MPLAPSPISLVEFADALRRCAIPALPRPAIAVANSAGPDSTCLLFLLRQLFPPVALLSIHVRHDLQSAAPHMAAAAAANARALAVPHLDEPIPWGVPPFPPAPSTDAPFERLARDARYSVLFRALARAHVPFLALAHHADDQVETAILRLARGSTHAGAAGMRPSRRWGMGSPHSPLASFGHRGLDVFLLRPLLPFPKDRILATCHAHRLHYINDPSNFVPHLTPRNAIRHCLRHDPLFSLPVSFPPSLSFDSAKQAFLALLSIGSDLHGTEKRRLYSAVASLASTAQLIDLSSRLSECALPSPTGSFFLSSSKLLDITDPGVRLALVLRVIRYVSFLPWGSLRADADRRQHRIHRIVRALWASDPPPSHLRKFTAGGGVLWSPAIFNPNRPLRVGNQCLQSVRQPHDHFGWLASRMPPFSKNPQHGVGSSSALVINLTEQLRAALSSNAPLHVLYDCRFLLRIDPSRMPSHIKFVLEKSDEGASIQILPFTQHYWPKVVLQRESRPDYVLAVPRESSAENETSSLSWISIRWIRLLDAA